MKKDIRELLPIGTVVSLNEGKKRLMIYGIIQSVEKTETEYDYIGVPYPEGNMGNEFQYLFNHSDVEKVYFRGFEDIERQEFIFNLNEYYNKETD